jgi:hypothetical protein
MNVICKRSLMFRDVRPDPNNPGHTRTLRKCVIPGAPGPQTAPDWIRQTPPFAHAAEAGVITEIVIRPAKGAATPAQNPAKGAATPAQNAQEADADDKSDDDAGETGEDKGKDSKGKKK